MSGDEPSSLAEQAQVQRMLRGLGQSTLSGHTSADDGARAERMAALIDDRVVELTERRQSSRRLGVTLLAAAVVLFSLGGFRYFRASSSLLTIEQEPLAIGKEKPPTSTPSATPQLPAVVPPRAVAPTARAGAASVADPAPAPAPSAAPSEPQSTLAQENRLFKEAAEATRTGDVEGALGRLDRLLAEHPASPLAQQAIVRRFRLLAAAGRTDEARREAERYLASYPTGFAVSEAEAVKAGTGGASGNKVPPGLESEQP